ncbi:uncharacterized protein M421DRAFT_88187 [Didymella exigua CBS 183.55]|uniref:Uncharacterized protein n=1 Tax=Didymella exigua CBS 183.55 TaxID=1150837 RepID=A0A6A5S405_9PLEO|nr:uncharacterized protein M421DRAFT_88187 [Didymella exigua CBS 183.55]KAF1934174.1 hypothetical protein M421DRAFT_88187 [Didymella exigua CBS 183.55]
MSNDRNSDSDDGEAYAYDNDDPRTREHNAYKISQENGARDRRGYRYGDAVDDDGENYSPDERDNHDTMERKLENALPNGHRHGILTGVLRSEANRRYAWNGQWAGGDHEGVAQEADRRMEEVAKWNQNIAKLERQIDHNNATEVHAARGDDGASGSGEDSSDEDETSDDEYEKNIKDGRSVRAGRFDAQSDDEDEDRPEEASDDEEWNDEGY